MKIEFPFLWIERDSKAWGVLLFTIVWGLWVLMCAVTILRNELKEAFCRWWKPQQASGAEQNAAGAKNKCPKNLGKRLKGWYEKYKRELAKAFGTAVLYTLLLYAVELLLPEDTAIHKAAGLLVQYSTLGVIVLSLATVYGFWLKSGRESYLNILLQAGSIWTLAVAAAAFISGTVEFSVYNDLWSVCLCAAAFAAMHCKLENAADTVHQDDPFGPTKTFDELIGARRKEAEQLTDWIDANRQKNYSICITGEWGSGKTSFVNGVIDKLNSKNRQDCVIWVRTLELDSLENLLQYLFGEIRRELKKRGAYVGISSEYQQFLRAAAASLTTQETSGILGARLFHTPENYREKRDALDQIIRQTMGDSLFLVVVDDIERCSADKIQQFVAFIREAATLNNCVPIFLTDYEQLMKIEKGKKFDEKFFDKFFNRRVELVQVMPEEIMKELEQESYKELYADSQEKKQYSKLRMPQEIYSFVLEKIEDKIKECGKQPEPYKRNAPEYKGMEEENKKKQLQIQAAEKRIKEDFSNPREVRQFYECVQRHWKQCFEACLSDKVPDKIRQSNAETLQDIKVENLLWLVSFAEVWYSLEQTQMEKQGIQEYFFGEHELVKDELDKVILKMLHEVLLEASELADLGIKVYKNYQIAISLGIFDQIFWGKKSNGQSGEWIEAEEGKFACLPVAKSVLEKTANEIEQDRCTDINREDYRVMLNYALRMDDKPERREMLLKKIFSIAAQKDASLLHEHFFPELLYANDRWCIINGSFKLFDDTYCAVLKAPGYNLSQNELSTLDDWEKCCMVVFFNELILFIENIAQDEKQEDALENLMQQQKDMEDDPSPNEVAASYLKKLIQIVPELKLEEIKSDEAVEIFSGVYQRVKNVIKKEGILEKENLEKVKIYQEWDKELGESVENMTYCLKVMDFFRQQKRTITFETCINEEKVEQAAQLLIEKEWSSDLANARANIRTLKRCCQATGKTLSENTIKEMQSALRKAYKVFEQDREIRDTLRQMQVDIGWMCKNCSTKQTGEPLSLLS